MKDSVTAQDSSATADSTATPAASRPAASTPAASRSGAPRALAAWIALGALGALSLLAGSQATAWGVVAGARFTLIGSLLATVVALWVCALFSARESSHEPKFEAQAEPKAVATNVVAGALPGLTAALALRILSEVLGMSIGAGALPTARLMLANVLLIASSVALSIGVALWTLPTLPGRQKQQGGAQLLWLIDGLIGGGALVALGWWLWRVPLMLTTAPAGAPTSGGGVLGLWALCGVSAALMMALAAAVDAGSKARFQTSAAVGQLRARRISALLFVVALLVWVVADARFLSAGTRGAITSFDLALRWLAPFLLGASVLLRPLSATKTQDSQTTDETAQNEVARDGWALLPSRLWRDLWIVVLPCAVILVGAWRLGAADLRAAVISASVGALWWGPLLLLVAVGRYIAALRTGTQSLGETARLRNRLQRTTKTLEQRTHQLSTLHSATADLSELRNCEHILSTAIERTLSALNAPAGAVWLHVAGDEVNGQVEAPPGGAHSGRVAEVTVPIETFVWRELERSGSERRAIASLDASFDKSAGARIGGSQGEGVSARDKQWSMVLARGHQSAQGKRALYALQQALSHATGLQRFAQRANESDNGGQTDFQDDLNAPKSGTIVVEDSAHVQRTGHAAKDADDAATIDIWHNGHIAEIRSKGHVLGAIGIVREGAPLDKAERALVSALAFEAGTALQNVQLYQEMSRLADRDSLTDLFNHRAIQGQLNALLGRAQRSQTPLAVVMMDLNNFKFFNDTYGHPEGDRVLRIVARCLVDVCRTGDIVGRFGGDEFIALLVDTDEEGALQACHRIASRVEEEGYQQPGESRRIPITLSFGAAIYAEDGNSALELLAAADASLYEAKRGGASIPARRNQDQDAQELKKLKEAGTGGSFGVLDALVTAIDNKDHYTRQHSEDVTQWASLMARQLEYSSETQRAVRIAGLLHDVGKIAVPDAVLRKPGRLNDDEFNIMQQHPVFGALIVKDVPNLPEVLGGIRHHHERFDGKGYPDKLRGEDIPLLGRLLAVPDCFSAMTTDRPYRKALTWSEAFSEIENGKGTQFDPLMADAFLEVMARIVSGEENVFVGDDDDEVAGVANQVARSMAESEPVVVPDGDDSQFRPRSVADAETK